MFHNFVFQSFITSPYANFQLNFVLVTECGNQKKKEVESSVLFSPFTIQIKVIMPKIVAPKAKLKYYQSWAKTTA